MPEFKVKLLVRTETPRSEEYLEAYVSAADEAEAGRRVQDMGWSATIVGERPVLYQLREGFHFVDILSKEEVKA